MDQNAINQRLNTLQKLKEKLLSDIEVDKRELKELQSGKKATIKKKQQPREQQKSVKKEQKKPLQKPVKKVYTEEEIERKKSYLALRKKVSDEQFFKRLKPMLDTLPESNGSRFYNKVEANIGIIADEFLFNSYNGVTNLHYIERENYKQHSGKLDALLVVTTWKGLNMEWKGLGNPNIKRHRQDLYEILDFYRKQGTKILFYSKEDPVNYHIFIEIAKQCDYVFTTAVEKIEDYKRDCNNDNVHLLEFGVNPFYHNPIGIKKYDKLKEVLFTGSWYDKYPHRQTDTRILFDGVIEGDKELKIIDRNYDLKLIQYFFPEEYLKYVSPSIEHAYLQKFHKLFDWAINLNSIQESNTMFANRIYELQALGNILLSNYSVGVNNKFPGVFLVQDKHEIKDIFNAYSKEEVFKHQVNGIRRVMSTETTFQRMEHLLNTIGIEQSLPQRSVAVVVKEKTAKLIKMFEQQTYDRKELFTEKEFDEQQKAMFDFVAFFEEQYDYNTFYLEDMLNGFKYTDSDYVTNMKDKNRTVFWSNAFSLQQLIEMNKEIALPNGFSIDRFNFNDVPTNVEVKKEHKLSVIIPTYNNGDHLLNKCFNSLRRSSMFEDMEIVLVDDGSTDGYTPKIVQYLEKQYKNVKTFYFNDGGSGSASRPRNKGFELTTAPHITYLDPDNEAINDGFAKLYKEAKKGKFDLTIGNMIRLDKKLLNFDYYKTAVQFYGSDVLTTGIREYLVKTQFKAMSIQALIAKREIIGNHELKMVEGAVGQDTIFFQELLLNSQKVKVINEPIHIYYAAVEGSAVNTISKTFFERYFKLEKYRVQMLKENDLFNEYVEQRFAYYFQNWYLKKLKLVQSGDEKEAVQLLGNILDLYGNIDHLYKKRENIDTSQMDRFLSLNAEKDYEKMVSRFVK